MLYADLTYYAEKWVGNVDNATFPRYLMNATLKIKQYIGDNIGDNIPDEVKNCCCELAEYLYRDELERVSGGVSSESVGGWSKSYETAEARKKSSDKNIHDIIYKWLYGTGLLFAGVR